MADGRIREFDSVALLEELESDHTRLEKKLRLLRVQDRQRDLLKDRVRHLHWLAAAVRDGEFLSSTVLTEIVSGANHLLGELKGCEERSTLDRHRLEAEFSELVETKTLSPWIRLWRRLRRSDS